MYETPLCQKLGLEAETCICKPVSGFCFEPSCGIFPADSGHLMEGGLPNGQDGQEYNILQAGRGEKWITGQWLHMMTWESPWGS